MAGRPLKQGLDYFSLDVDFFQSAKVRKIIKGCGFQAVSVLICLLSNTYRKDGYYLRWDEDMPFMISEELGRGAKESMVTEVLASAVSTGFFHPGIFEEYGVLTSEGIQERFFTASERRKRIEIIQEFFLLNPSEIQKNAVWKSATTMPFFKKKRDFGINVDNNSINVSNNSINVDTNEQSKVKESKVNERERETKVEYSRINVDNNSINVSNNSIIEETRSLDFTTTTLSPSVLEVYQREMRPPHPGFGRKKLEELAATYGEEATTKAIERAVVRGKNNLGYAEAILKSWMTNGYDEESLPGRPKENPQLAMAKQAMEMLRGENPE